ncbi:NAD(P)-dependent dehydrogenase (short-subunit alcohol dehydrogenase family) [Acidovorax soli]|uniref:NAD(P)-dependent dehydrogenase (Short-subunit alcohol dehydrogenase family) n=1 Tax=Acidovorax soli TaxID=592050 RepID=A0A7X0P8Z9_9BURK|nr:SDR family NAD(P)-dependent oxidoreductase [Acidovorax soli]MBB6557508.1 NAD(P)-dependent dehydrogenase (short-subunit alcohol dehydrogenase family) [Acidovorax soli]
MQNSDNRLSGRRILITGAASGIGRATATLFAAQGAALTLLDRDPLGLQDIARQTGAQAFETDITDEESVDRAVSSGAEFMGGIDGVVNAAGVMLRGSVLEVGLAEWRRVLEINLTGSYIVVRSCLPWLQRSTSATIVNLGSGQSLLPNSPNRTAYSASKGGVLNLTRALAAELAPSIRANTVCPGLVDTAMADGVRVNVSNYALQRLAQPEEIARAILFLTSEESSYVTGAALAVDGGRSFH